MSASTIDYSRKWYVMAAIAMSIFLSTIDESIVNVALPTLVRDLDTNFAAVQWVILAYLLTQTTLMLSVGRLGDMIGKKTIFITGFVVFTFSSVLCGLAPTIFWLIAFRVLQATGAAMALALGFAITIEAFPPNEKGKAMGAISTIVSVGIVLGPTVGGFIIDALSWRWIFFVNLPIGIIGTAMALRYVPNTAPATGQQRFDYWGGVALFVSLLSLLLALTLGQELGFSQPVILLLFVTSAIFLATFIIVERRTAQPMIDLNFFANKLFSSDLIVRITSFFVLAGTLVLLPFYLENLLGYSTRQVGLLLTVVPICVGLVSPVAGSLADRFSPRPMMVAGLLTLLAGYVALSTLTTQTTTWGYILRLFPIGLGIGLFQSPNNSAIMGAAPPGKLGIISGLMSISRTLGQTAGIAVLGAVWAGRVIYRHGVVPPGGATAAPTLTQVAGLQDTFITVSALALVALLISIWALVRERQDRQVASSAIG